MPFNHCNHSKKSVCSLVHSKLLPALILLLVGVSLPATHLHAAESDFVSSVSASSTVGAPSAAEPDLSAAAAVVQKSISIRQELLDRMNGAGDSSRIVLHSLEPSERLAGQLSALLTALGAKRVEQRLVDAVPENNQIRYYYSADREAGQAVGAALGLVFDEIAVRDFADYSPLPSEGLIEVWLR